MTIIFYFIIFVTTVLAVSEIPQVPRVDCQGLTNQFHPYPKICNIYYECKRGQMYVKMCKSGLNFNFELGICDHTEPKDCVVARKKKIENRFCPQQFIGQVPDPDNCRQFIVCFFGTHHYKNCEFDSVYNRHAGFCDHPSNVPECSENIKRHNTENETNNSNFTPYYMNHSYNDHKNETGDSFNQANASNSNLTINYIFSHDKQFKIKNDTVQREIPVISQKSQSTNSENAQPFESQHNYWTRHWGPF